MRTVIESYPEIFRNERGLHLSIHGQTFSPRPNSDSAKFLAAQALRIQLGNAAEDGYLVGSPWTAAYEFTTSRLVVTVYDVLELHEGLTTVVISSTLKGSRLTVDKATYFRGDDEEKDKEERFVPSADQNDALRTRLQLIIADLIELVPELKARVDQVVLLATVAATVEHVGTEVPARTLMKDDIISVKVPDGNAEQHRVDSVRWWVTEGGIAQLTIDTQLADRDSSFFRSVHHFAPDESVLVISRAGA